MNTSFTEAIFDIFEQISKHNKSLGMEKTSTIYLAGGAAVHFYTNARRSDDVDAIMEPIKPALPEHLGTTWDNNGTIESLDFDMTYHPYFGLLAEDYMDRAVHLKNIGGNISLYVLHPIDLAITKVLRYSDSDAEDIAFLVQHESFDIALFKELAQSCLDARGMASHYQNNIQWVVDAYSEFKANQIQEIIASVEESPILKDALFDLERRDEINTPTRIKP